MVSPAHNIAGLIYPLVGGSAAPDCFYKGQKRMDDPGGDPVGLFYALVGGSAAPDCFYKGQKRMDDPGGDPIALFYALAGGGSAAPDCFLKGQKRIDSPLQFFLNGIDLLSLKDFLFNALWERILFGVILRKSPQAPKPFYFASHFFISFF